MTPADIRQHWDAMKPVLERMFQDTDQRPEEVFAAVLYGHASLYVVPYGWFVLRPFQNPSNGELHALIWVAYCNGGDAVEKHLPGIVQIAKDAGATRLVMESNRPGWARRLPDWRQTMTTYELRLSA